MLKNFVKEGQKLPLYGVGPFIVYGMVMVTVIGIVLLGHVFKIGVLGSPWILVFRIFGVVLILLGAFVWFIGALRSGMDENISENKLKTDGIYAWVRNPMYSGCWIALFGLSLMWHNILMLFLPVINWLIMTIALINSEEKWLLNLYGNEYAEYKKRVNRCIPFFPGVKKPVKVICFILAVVVAGIVFAKVESGRTDADLVLTIEENGFEGHFYDAGEKEKVVITFSGSDGGSSASDTMAWYYKEHGISALGVTLFAGKDTGKYLDEVPLEYVEKAIEWLHSQGYEKIAVDGVSKGSEYALLAASQFDDITCVVARAPSYFISEGMIGKKAPSGTSCWSYQGEGFAYTPYKVREFDVVKQFSTHHEFNILEYNSGKEVLEESVIPMEKINGPILLLSTESDTVWPSAEQADYIENYLEEKGFPHEVVNAKYKYISHFIIPMRRNTWLLKMLFLSEKEYPEECEKERTDLSEKAIDFIQNHW